MPIIGDEYGDGLLPSTAIHWQIGIDLNNSVHMKDILYLLMKLFNIAQNSQLQVLETGKLEQMKWVSNTCLTQNVEIQKVKKKKSDTILVPKEVIKRNFSKIKQYRISLFRKLIN